MTGSWNIVMTRILEHCDEKGNGTPCLGILSLSLYLLILYHTLSLSLFLYLSLVTCLSNIQACLHPSTGRCAPSRSPILPPILPPRVPYLSDLVQQLVVLFPLL